MVTALEQMVDELGMEPKDDEMLVVVDAKPVLVVEAYSSDNKMPHNDLVENEIVVAVVEELIRDLTEFQQCSKYIKNMTLIIALKRK